MLVGLPATKNAHDNPIIPSPVPTRPRAVSQAESTTKSAFKSSFMISHASSNPSSLLSPLDCASSTYEYIALLSFRIPCVAGGECDNFRLQPWRVPRWL